MFVCVSVCLAFHTDPVPPCASRFFLAGWGSQIVNATAQQSISTLEAKGRTNVRQEARDIFESHMEEDCAEGRTPLGLPKKQGDEPRVIYSRALLVVGRKCGGG